MNRKDRRKYWNHNHKRDNLGTWDEYNEMNIPKHAAVSKKRMNELFPAKIETENLETK